ncbi:MAG: phage tail protein, partial [Candidatus Marinimicrobia bacterium]|nr:phage tail protein [Candidatus Neomarinimicrobiota bacterium]
LLSGVTAKLHFNTGNLGGYEFEVSAYNNSTKEITIIAYKDDQGYEMPNATLKPAVGDKYVLLDIFLPQSYIDTAETALQAKAQAYIDDNSEPRVTYILTPDPRYFKTHLIELEAGDFITIQDTVLGIDVMTRIVELTKSVTDEYKYTLKLTDHLEVQLIQRIYDEQGDLKEKIEIGEGGDIIRSRRNWRTSEELRVMVFDTDGYFDMGNIRPESVSTSMLSVGSKSTQFILSSVEIEGNYTSDVSKFHASAGSLIHLSIADAIRTWTLSSNSQGL